MALLLEYRLDGVYGSHSCNIPRKKERGWLPTSAPLIVQSSKKLTSEFPQMAKGEMAPCRLPIGIFHGPN